MAWGRPQRQPTLAWSAFSVQSLAPVQRAKAAETELAILSSYGPKQMTESELREAINDFRAKNPDANVGTIMAHLKTNFGGQYDGKTASALARG